ncbi:MAG: helix-turn-helix transcriptional regulator [Clostridiales bacterium]|nr:helix-turn-helix transcriptional regulator [Clostridiales bacterium]
MILADKIIMLRKRYGWSQEELAEKMQVTRQSVSKWEGAQSIPDLDKILRLSQIFGVSTDYLLKDELEDAEYSDHVEDTYTLRRVTMEEANAFLSIKEFTAKRIALATFLCIISPITLFLLNAARESQALTISEALASGIGLIVLFLLVAVAVAVFITSGSMTSQYEFLEKESFETEYGVSGMVRERQKQYRATYTKYNVIGACLCILSVIPLFIGGLLSEDGLILASMLSITMLLAGVGAMFFINAGINWASMEKLLQEGDYSRKNKQRSPVIGAIATVYWLLVVAAFLAYSFFSNDWQNSWIIWPVAGVLFAVLMVICNALDRKER